MYTPLNVHIAEMQAPISQRFDLCPSPDHVLQRLRPGLSLQQIWRKMLYTWVSSMFIILNLGKHNIPPRVTNRRSFRDGILHRMGRLGFDDMDLLLVLV